MVSLGFPRPRWDTGLVRWYRSARMGWSTGRSRREPARPRRHPTARRPRPVPPHPGPTAHPWLPPPGTRPASPPPPGRDRRPAQVPEEPAAEAYTPPVRIIDLEIDSYRTYYRTES